ncbi:17980_t:CDS:2 [Rhizophagus irregularis]|nr:17980_t:CDS:2 [Rhizophagus irregularis]
MPSSSISIGKNLPFFLQSQSLTLLIYKQSREIEEMLTKIHSIDLFDNFENPEDIADIPIITSNLYIVRIVEMYEKELCYKKNLIFENGLSGGMNGVKLIGERWAAQPYLLFEMEEEMCDRIKVWKRVKEFGSIK